jgi:hypothetical protein
MHIHFLTDENGTDLLFRLVSAHRDTQQGTQHERIVGKVIRLMQPVAGW